MLTPKVSSRKGATGENTSLEIAIAPAAPGGLAMFSNPNTPPSIRAAHRLAKRPTAVCVEKVCEEGGSSLLGISIPPP